MSWFLGDSTSRDVVTSRFWVIRTFLLVFESIHIIKDVIGFPSFALPTFDYFVPLIPGMFSTRKEEYIGCIIVSVIAFVITFSLGKIFARKVFFLIPLGCVRTTTRSMPIKNWLLLDWVMCLAPSCLPILRLVLFLEQLWCIIWVYDGTVESFIESKTQFHNFISPLIIIFCLYLLTGILLLFSIIIIDFIKYLPKSTLAAVVEINLISLFKQVCS